MKYPAAGAVKSARAASRPALVDGARRLASVTHENRHSLWRDSADVAGGGDVPRLRHSRAVAEPGGSSGWLRGVDLNHRPRGYEPRELPGCSTPRQETRCQDPFRWRTPQPSVVRADGHLSAPLAKVKAVALPAMPPPTRTRPCGRRAATVWERLRLPDVVARRKPLA